MLVYRSSNDLKLLAWNVNGGLSNKLDNKSFLNLICTYDIVFLTECWIDRELSIDIPGYKCFCILD